MEDVQTICFLTFYIHLFLSGKKLSLLSLDLWRRIRLLFRGVELSDNMSVAQLTGEELDLHFLVLGQDEERHLKFWDSLCKF